MPVQRRAHHVVPQFYLRRFADAEKRIWAIDIATNRGELTPVKRATVISGFYLFNSTTAEEHEGWEAVFGLIEDGAARSIQTIVDRDQWPLPKEPRGRLANWIAAQYLRTPKMRAYLDDSLEEWRRSVDAGGPDAIRAASGRLNLTDDEARELWGDADDVIPRGQPQRTGAYLLAFQDLLFGATKNVYERRWRLVKFDQPSLMTADEVIVPISVNAPLFPIITAAEMILVPLSRQVMLLVCELDKTGQRADDVVAGGGTQAGMFNRMIVDNADTTAFRHPDDSPMIAIRG